MDNKIKLNLKKKAVCTAKIGDTSIKIKPWLTLAEVVYIVEQVCNYGKDLISNGQSDAMVLVSVLAKMELYITALATNIDVDNVEADDLGQAGIFSIIKDKVLNYELIKTAILGGLGMIGDGFIIGQLGNIASLDDLEKAQEKIDNYMKDDTKSEQIKNLVEVMLANNPTVANELNNMMASGDEKHDGDEK